MLSSAEKSAEGVNAGTRGTIRAGVFNFSKTEGMADEKTSLKASTIVFKAAAAADTVAGSADED